MSLSAAPPPPAPVHPSSFHFAKSSVEPVTAQWTAREPKQKHDRTSSGGGGIKQLFGRKLAKPSSRSPSPSPAADMYAPMFPQNNASQSQPFPQQQPQQQPFPSSAHTSSHGHGARGVFDPEFDDYERQLDYETDANTSYNAAKLSANLRQPSAPSPNQRPRTKSKSSKGKDRERSSSESRARRQAVMDKARRERRRAGQLDSDTTQGEDTDSDEYVTGYGNTKPVAGMFGSAGAVGAGGAGAGAGGGGGGPRGA
ncbi:hypothetical protein BDV93DRAFT_557372 [Ceratobasidium sp. AG-I]|nr:hypothetical protein BDV93DRAFT_557372 [Ceratobasidium sp. AG-I]